MSNLINSYMSLVIVFISFIIQVNVFSIDTFMTCKLSVAIDSFLFIFVVNGCECVSSCLLVPLNETSQFNYYHSHFYFTFSLVIFFLYLCLCYLAEL